MLLLESKLSFLFDSSYTFKLLRFGFYVHQKFNINLKNLHGHTIFELFFKICWLRNNSVSGKSFLWRVGYRRIATGSIETLQDLD